VVLIYKSERARAAAPPFKIEPAALGFDFAAALRAAFYFIEKISFLTVLCK